MTVQWDWAWLEKEKKALAQTGEEAGQYKDIFRYFKKMVNGRYTPKMFVYET